MNQHETDNPVYVPLSYRQETFLSFYEHALDGHLEPISVALQIHSAVDVDRLRSLLQILRQRHAVLRTAILSAQSEFVQVINQASAIEHVPCLEAIDCAGQSWDAIVLIAAQHAHCAFSLENGPLWRAALFSRHETCHLLQLSFHPLIADVDSIWLLLDEFLTLCGAASKRIADPLPLVTDPYPQFVDWEQSQLQEREVQLQYYWQQTLAGALPILQLPWDHQHAPTQTNESINESNVFGFEFDREVIASLDKLATNTGTTRQAILLATFQILLHRYSRQHDIVVGLRSKRKDNFARSIGYFENPLMLRSTIDAENAPQFNRYLQQVYNHLSAAIEHQIYPFHWLAETLQTEANPSNRIHFQALFDYREMDKLHDETAQLLLGRQIDFADLRLSLADMRWNSSVPPWIGGSSIQLSLTGWRNEVTAQLHVNAALIDTETIARMAGHFQTLLQAIVDNPNQSIAKLPLLTKQEQHQLLGNGPEPARNYPSHKSIHQLFEEQVERTPDAVAVVYEDQHLTYDELNQRANQLAHHLQGQGVGNPAHVPFEQARASIPAETLVGLCVERSIDLVVGILGILKAGGAYVPLDPAYPPERLAFMVEDAQLALIVAQPHLHDRLPQSSRTIMLDAENGALTACATTDPDSQTGPDSLAYVIYTSGSTGKPKGVLVSHTNVVRLFSATNEWFHFNQHDVWTLFHSYAFDFSVWELWGSLLYGGKVVVVPYLVSRSPESFYQLLLDEGVTVLNQTPSAFYQLMHSEADRSSAERAKLALRYVIFGGEALNLAALHPWFARHGDQRPQLVNMYGITETTVHVTYRSLVQADIENKGSMIGGAIPDLQLFILDEEQQIVPIGIAGELYVGGAGVSRGYLNRPELTAQRFVHTSYSPKPLYRTGDLARRLANGDIEYLGRIDTQVKIRGFRIELGEIQSVLSQHPQVREAVVLVHEEAENHKRLTAYVVPQHAQLTAEALSLVLHQQLPDYMVPSSIHLLDAIPLTNNGKVDSQQLAALPIQDSENAELYAVPTTPTEQKLAEIWADVLGQQRVGIDDNFFHLGGDSILSIQIVARAKALGMPLAVQHLFQKPTIAQLAQMVDMTNVLQPETITTAPFSLIERADHARISHEIEDAYPLSALQMGMLFHTTYEADSAVYHDIFSHHIAAPFDVEAFQRAVQELTTAHPILRTRFALSGYTVPLQLVHRTATLPIEVFDLRQLNADEQQQTLERDFHAEQQRGFDWQIPPLLRLQLHRCTETMFSLTLSFHHVILDGWSRATLTSELLQRYAVHLGLESRAVAQPAGTYRDFIAFEQTILQDAEQGEYWRQKLADATFNQLPRLQSKQFRNNNKNNNDKNDKASESGQLLIHFSKDITTGVQQLARRAETSVKAVLLAAHLYVISTITNQQEVVTGLVSNGRPETTDGERILGLFLNTLPLRMTLNGGSWLELVQAVAATERELLPHRHYPLVEIQRLVGGSTLFEAGFNFTHFHVFQNVAAIPGIDLLDERVFEYGNYPLAVVFGQNPGSHELSVYLGYKRTELVTEQVAEFGRYYERTLETMTCDPLARYELFSPLSLEDRHQILSQWNATTVDAPTQRPIHQWVAQQAATTPDARALVFHSAQTESAPQVLTYGELNQRANQLARHLQQLGVGPETIVGLCLPRSMELVVGIMGILKAGGAYLPLDPTYPAERLQFMLADAAPTVILTQSDLLAALPTNVIVPSPAPVEGETGFDKRSLRGECEPLPATSAKLVCFDRDGAQIAQQPTHNPAIDLTPDNLAYVIYTSGSTGKPKGVQVTHRGIPNLAQAQIKAFGLKAGSRQLQYASSNFDASVSEVMTALCAGAELHLAERDTLLPGPGFIAFLQEQAITHVTLPPSILAALPDAPLPALETLIVAGEACSPNLAAKWARGRRFLNAYGPTEATVCATIAAINADQAADYAHLPIGRPIDNTQIYILNDQQQPVPIGTPGELYIGGVGIARGYLNQPELTADRFLQIDLGDGLVQRLYKTGDRARWLPDGQVEFLGRVDNQIKLRGFRIELDEIRNLLNEHSAVQDSAVIVRETAGREAQIVAYITPQSAEGLLPQSSQPVNGIADEAIEFFPSITGFSVIDELMYYAMTQDEGRLNAYRVALQPLVAGKTVVEIGPGRDAVLAIFCAQAGAAKVYAIEIDSAVCDAARAQVAALGLADRIEVIHGDATQVTLPEQADLCVSSIIGSIGGSEGATVILNQARRLLKPDGIMLPERSITQIAAVTLPDALRLQPQLTGHAAYYTQKIFDHVGYPFDLRLCIRNFPQEKLLSDTDVFEDLDFRDVIEPEGRHTIDLTMTAAGRLDGFLLWVSLQVTQASQIDTLHSAHSLLPVYLPVFTPGIDVAAGDRVQAECIRTLADNGLNPEYTLVGQIHKTNGQIVDFHYLSHHAQPRYQQTPFYQQIFGADPITTATTSRPLPPGLPQWDLADVRHFLQQRLPDYMMPAHLVPLTNLPISPNGKLDRRALPDPLMQTQAETPSVRPQTELERQLATIWQTLLEREDVGIHDNFFDLGGHSLMMMKVHTQLQEIWPTAPTITDLFEHPTVHRLAQHMSRQQGGNGHQTRTGENGNVHRQATTERTARRTERRQRRAERRRQQVTE